MYTAKYCLQYLTVKVKCTLDMTWRGGGGGGGELVQATNTTRSLGYQEIIAPEYHNNGASSQCRPNQGVKFTILRD